MSASIQQMMANLSTAGLGSADTFAMAYKYAREWEKAEKAGDTRKLQKLDFGVGPMVRLFFHFHASGCQAVIYCSRACQVADWKTPKMPRAPTHKELCASNKASEHMKRIPYFTSVLRQFPWARIEPDGTCSHDVLKARLGVLGSGISFGYWSVPGGLQPHDDSTASRGEPDSEAKKLLRVRRTEGYVHGDVLRDEAWPTDVDMWKIKDKVDANGSLVPRLFFSDEFMPPVRVERGQVYDWKSWYEWRGLSMASPASLLMDYPMTVYHLLTDILHVVNDDATVEKRQALEVHYIGAEVELNFLPLFSELALLLPHVDITLVFFGKAVYDLVRSARQKYPGSLATQDIVWSYTSPKKAGGGSVVIKLYSQGEAWTRGVAKESPPDALVGLNAGLLNYTTWSDPVIFSAVLNIPFAITDYAEQSMETCATGVQTMLRGQASHAFMPGSPHYAALTRTRSRPITVNPFHRPGQRPLPVVRMPNYYNGFAMPLVVKSSD
ncbi:hypothetical protein BKA93DRAFT_734251 [Sparassis latifolia]